MKPWRRAQMTLLWLGARSVGRISSSIGGWLAAGLWFTPWPTPSTPTSMARESAWLAGTTPQEWVVDGRRLHGFSAGRGPTVLLVHGWGEQIGRMGAFVAPLVAGGFRVVGVDLPGHGRNGLHPADLPTLSRALRAVGESLGTVHAIVGHSLGATASMLAVRDGLSPGALVLLAPPVRLENAVERFRDMLGLPEPAVRGLRRRIERRFGESVWQDYAADRLELDLPALIIHDADDPQVDLADARLLVDAWPQASLMETAGLGHHRTLRDEAVIAAVMAFTREGTAASSRRHAAASSA